MQAPIPFTAAQSRAWLAVSLLSAVVFYTLLNVVGEWLAPGTVRCGTPQAQVAISLALAASLAYALVMAYATGRLLRQALPQLSLAAWVVVTSVWLPLVLTGFFWLFLCTNNTPDSSPTPVLLYLDRPLHEALLFMVITYVISFPAGLLMALPQALVLLPVIPRWGTWMLGSGFGIGLAVVGSFIASDVLALSVPSVSKAVHSHLQMALLFAIPAAFSVLTLRYMLEPQAWQRSRGAAAP